MQHSSLQILTIKLFGESLKIIKKGLLKKSKLNFSVIFVSENKQL